MPTSSEMDWKTFACNCAEHGIQTYMNGDPKKMKKKSWGIFACLDDGVRSMITAEKSDFTIPHIIEFLTTTGKFPNSKIGDDDDFGSNFLLSDMECWNTANQLAERIEETKIKNRNSLLIVINLSKKTGFPEGNCISATRCWDEELGITE